MPCEHVDRTTIAGFVERELGDDLPPTTSELRDDRLDDPRVAPIDEAIRVPAAPSELEHGFDPEDGADASKFLDRDTLQLPPFKQRDDLLVDARRPGQIDLAHAEVNTHGGDQASGALIGHATIVAGWSALRLIRRCAETGTRGEGGVDRARSAGEAGAKRQ